MPTAPVDVSCQPGGVWAMLMGSFAADWLVLPPLGSPWIGHHLPRADAESWPKARTLKSLGSSEEEEEEAGWEQGCAWRGCRGGFRATSPPSRGPQELLPGVTTGTAFNRVPCPPPPAWGNDLHTPALSCRGWGRTLCSPGTYQRPGNKFF